MMKLGDQVVAAALCPAFQRGSVHPSATCEPAIGVASWAFSGVASGLHLAPVAPSF